MKVKVVNSSSRRTREKIKNAFAVLMKEKNDLNKITVTALVAKAEITRSAFYTHYDNIYDVAGEIHDDVLDFLISSIDKLKNLENIDEYFDEIFSYINKNHDFYSMILSSNTPLFFTESLSKTISKYINESLGIKNNKDLNLKLSLFTDGSISLVIKYFRGEVDFSLDEINDTVKKTFKILFLNKG